MEKWYLLSRLRRAVNKVKVLLNFNMNRWRIASMIGTSRSSKRLSFTDRPGLRACADDNDSEYLGYCCNRLARITSYPSEDDIDKRAEMFIANFHRQLQIERQVSLELKYLRLNNFDNISP
ncbi:uncharacterized protein LOC108468699 [Gossypium arboreum]|uniref:Uncharacterized protein n=1 Tax=Gossypium arboreum TaxID=29729 RepID=A0ABR0NZ62_GOSAR|nr:uncharacterized protein LOC108468699 [Gossypium arboreum]KAK5811651.1 hypothetical protein PVK06_027005 [Gossypium arboreum]